ncbi:hypothetical protein WMF26_15240 [Sorangium sp. So ce185]|uniref:hypothetical protein n=1 Tax=Sorangium sp. So ce185 TaxID=3133287 RepID=UPI003F5FB85E
MAISAVAPAWSCSCAADSMVDAPYASSAGVGGDGGQGASSGSGGEGGGGGHGGEGQGGSVPAETGVEATETVTAGEVARSSRYRMVFTLGQPTQNQGTSASPKVRMQGGLLGANGSLP